MLCKIYSFKHHIAKRTEKIKPILFLQKISLLYLLSGILSLTVFVTVLKTSEWLVIFGVGSLLAAVQTYLIAMMVRAVSLFQHKRDDSSIHLANPTYVKSH